MTQTKNNVMKNVLALMAYLLRVLREFIKIFSVQAGVACLFLLAMIDESTVNQLSNMSINRLLLIRDEWLVTLFNLSTLTTAVWIGWRDGDRLAFKIRHIFNTYRKAS